MTVPPLRGFTVGVTAERRAQDQAVMLSRLGIDVVLGPTMVTLPPVDEQHLREVTEGLVGQPPDDLVANTGFGIRAWLASAEEWGLAEPLVAALGARTRISARGPKAVGALRSAGLPVWWRAPDEQLHTVGQHLVATGVAGRRVAVQLHGDDRQDVTASLQAAGAEVIEIPVYRWELPPDAAGAAEIIHRAVAGTLDAVTFTAGPQIRNMMAMARRLGLADDLLGAFDGGRVAAACVGPVCAAVAEEEGIARSIVPEQWRLGALIRVLGDHLARRRWVLRANGHEAQIQNAVAVVDGREVPLDPDERALLECLRESRGEPVAAPGPLVTALAERLGPAGQGIVAAEDGWRVAGSPGDRWRVAGSPIPAT